MTCAATLQSDEFFCPKCDRRWAKDEPRQCRVAAEVDAIETVLAKAIVGPRMDKWIGRQKMLALRDHKWSEMATRNEQRDATTSARAVLKELKAMPRDELLRALDQGNWE